MSPQIIYEALLTSVYVCEETDKCKLPSFSLSHYHQQKEIVLTSIERILSKKGYGKNVLTYGFCLMSPDPFALSCGVNVESRYPNSSVNRLFYPVWETLLSRTGDAVMMYLLEHTSVFHQVTPTCMVQISGTPLNNLPEIATQDHNNFRTINTGKQICQNTNTDDVIPNKRESKEKGMKTDSGEDDVDDLVDLKENYVNDFIDPKENNSRKVSIFDITQLDLVEGTDRENVDKKGDGEINGGAVENSESVEVTDMYSGNKRKSGMYKNKNKCKRYKLSKNTMIKSSNSKRMKKYEDISENRYQDLKRRSAVYAISRKEGDRNVQSEDCCLEVAQGWFNRDGSTKSSPDNVNQKKRKFCDTNIYTENNDVVEASSEAREIKRRRVQSQKKFESDFNVIGGSECNTVDVIGQDDNKECKMNVAEGVQVHEQLDKKMYKGQTAKKKGKRKRHSKIATEIKADRQFCPFEFHLPLPRNHILLARNPREAFPKSVLLSRLDASPEDVVSLYRQIFCEMKVLSDSETIRVNCPCLNDVEVVQGVSEDKKTEESLEGDRARNHSNSYVINHQSFWNNSSGGNTFLPDFSAAFVPLDISHSGLNTLCRFPSSDRQNGKPDLSAMTAGVNYGNKENNSSGKVVNRNKICQQSDTENIDITEVLGRDSGSVASGSVMSDSVVSIGKQSFTGNEKFCETCTNRRSSKEELLAKRNVEIIMSRKCSSLNKFIEEVCENLGQQAKEGQEQSKEDKNPRCNSAHERTKISLLAKCERNAVTSEEKDEKSFQTRTSPAQQQDSSQIVTSPAQQQNSTKTGTSSALGLCSSQIRTSPVQQQDSTKIGTSLAQQQDSTKIGTSPAQNLCSSQIITSPALEQHSSQIRTSPAGLCSSQQPYLHNLHTSQHSVQCLSRRTVNIPAFTDVTLLLKKLIENHRSCPFKALVNYHCSVVCKKTESRRIPRNRKGSCFDTAKSVSLCFMSASKQWVFDIKYTVSIVGSTLSIGPPTREHGEGEIFRRGRTIWVCHSCWETIIIIGIINFCPEQNSRTMACIVRVVPLELLGKKHNLNILLKNVSKLVSLGKYDRLTLGQVMLGIKTSEVEWLSSTRSNSVKLHMLAKLILWLFGYILGIMKTFFYITDTGFLRYRLLYYRQITWNKLHSLGINGLINRKILKVISEKKALEMLQGRKSLGLSLLRFLLKQKSLRPIINMGSTVTLNSFKTLSVNKQLFDLHSILKYLKTRNPSLIGYGKLGNDDIYEAWKSYVNTWKKLGSPKLYFVKTDISKCYDSVMQDKLYSVMEDILNTEMSDEEFIIRKYFTVSMKNGCVKRRFTRVVTPMSEFNPDFMSYSKEVAESKGLKNTIFVDKVVYQHETSESQLKLLKQHLFSNLVKVGSNFCLQTCGISQGSVISTLLCSFYYAQMEKKLFELSEGEFLMRIVDDYIYVTPSQEHATSFLETMIKGVPAYNCYVNQEKILTNFTYGDNLKLPSVSAEWFPWCGVLFNTETLEVSIDFTKYSGCSIGDTMTMELSKTPGLSLKEKIVFSVRQKCHALYIDETINSEKQMLENLYQLFLFAVFKLHAYIRKLPHRQRADNNTKYFLDVIREMVYAVDCLVRNYVGENGKDISAMANWLCLKACCVKLSCHHANYKRLLKELSKQLECKQKCLAFEEKALLRNVVEPSMPVAFKYFLT